MCLLSSSTPPRLLVLINPRQSKTGREVVLPSPTLHPPGKLESLRSWPKMFGCRQSVQLQNLKVPFKPSSRLLFTLKRLSLNGRLARDISRGVLSVRGRFFKSPRNAALFCDTVLENWRDFFYYYFLFHPFLWNFSAKNEQNAPHVLLSNDFQPNCHKTKHSKLALEHLRLHLSTTRVTVLMIFLLEVQYSVETEQEKGNNMGPFDQFI